MNRIILKIVIIASISLISCASTYKNNDKAIGYNLTKPDLVIVLPDTLREVSGLTIADSKTFACVQDENGIIFIYDILNNKISNQYSFHIAGDYEGITKVDSLLFILQSDGILFEVSNYQKQNFKTIQHNTLIPANNNEGLCYDRDNNRLLIACKGKIGKGPENKDKRVIYAFDLESKTLSNEPVFDFDLQAIKDFAIKEELDLPAKNRKKKGQPITEPFIKFSTSAICIHPKTKQLFLLSATDYLLFVFKYDGTLEYIEKLDPHVFNKAEGISFFDNGDMLISNEGQDKKPTVIKFEYKNE